MLTSLTTTMYPLLFTLKHTFSSLFQPFRPGYQVIFFFCLPKKNRSTSGAHLKPVDTKTRPWSKTSKRSSAERQEEMEKCICIVIRYVAGLSEKVRNETKQNKTKQNKTKPPRDRTQEVQLIRSRLCCPLTSEGKKKSLPLGILAREDRWFKRGVKGSSVSNWNRSRLPLPSREILYAAFLLILSHMTW